MSDLFEDDAEARKRRKKIALVLLTIAAVLLAVVGIWWSNLADEDIENGPVSVSEGITDSADD